MASAQEKKTTRQVQKEGGADVTPHYVSHAEVQVTPWDFRIRLGRVDDITPELVVVRELVDLRMSPQHAKSLLQLLAEQMQKYEQAFGAIPDPRAAAREAK
jgi:hypothetical protein